MKSLTDSILPSHSQTLTSFAKSDIYTDLSGLEALKHTENKDEALKKIAQQFESIFVNQMLKGMRQANAVFEQDSPFSSEESTFYRDMHDQQLALTLSTGKGVGIAEAMYRQLSSQYGVSKPNPDKNVHSIDQQFLLRKVNARASQNIQNDMQPSKDTLNFAPSMIKVHDSHAKHTQVNVPPNAKASEFTTQQDNKADFAATPEQYIDSILPLFKKAGKELGVDPLVLVSQSALETGWGKKVLTDNQGQSSNNLFNIKAGSQWKDNKVISQSLEFKNGQFIQEKSEFRRYDSVAKSVSDYVQFIKSNPRYAKALESSSPRQYIQEIANAGYATDPDYVQKIMDVLKRVVSHVENIASPTSESVDW